MVSKKRRTTRRSTQDKVQGLEARVRSLEAYINALGLAPPAAESEDNSPAPTFDLGASYENGPWESITSEAHSQSAVDTSGDLRNSHGNYLQLLERSETQVMDMMTPQTGHHTSENFEQLITVPSLHDVIFGDPKYSEMFLCPGLEARLLRLAADAVRDQPATWTTLLSLLDRTRAWKAEASLQRKARLNSVMKGLVPPRSLDAIRRITWPKVEDADRWVAAYTNTLHQVVRLAKERLLKTQSLT